MFGTRTLAETDPEIRQAIDAETRAALRSLGYVVETPEGVGDGIDPKDGVKLLAELEAATGQLRSGAVEPAVDGLAAQHVRNKPRTLRILRGGRDEHDALARTNESQALLLALAHGQRRQLRKLPPEEIGDGTHLFGRVGARQAGSVRRSAARRRTDRSGCGAAASAAALTPSAASATPSKPACTSCSSAPSGGA